ncbi:AAA family ATPase [Saccharopolyspora sp. K220]|uniref:ATP-binding protein n=1 Tax=Saccharopolyspora soli TaxID=2926618 RepID=UPI001F57FDC5|nr:AAA family ATPase [Saccharopolyspora soli]MCI2421013.1 AAA family ATPase [Saccharopolyspora soli]
MTPRLPQGVLGLHALPADHHEGPWDSIFVPGDLKARLLRHCVLVLRHGRRLAQLAGPPHGLVLLAGPPGTGKSTLAQGLAQRAALAVSDVGATTFVEIDPHAFPSDMLGESQRSVAKLFHETLPELAARRPHLIVLVDEVEALAVRRSTASFETNPVDVHRATDAVLAGVDALRASCPRTIVVTTTNFPAAVDDALLSRTDFVARLDLPDDRTVRRIIEHSLAEIAAVWPAAAAVQSDTPAIAEAAHVLRGFDGRQIRKAVLAALIARDEVAIDPGQLTGQDVVTAARTIAANTTHDGATPPAAVMSNSAAG